MCNKNIKELNRNCDDKFRIMIPFESGSGTQGIFPTMVIFSFLVGKGGRKMFANYSLHIFMYLKYFLVQF